MEGDQKLKTKLVKQGDSFGFELGVSAAGSKMVTKVHPGSKAAAGAELMVGDEIYFMNKVSFSRFKVCPRWFIWEE